MPSMPFEKDERETSKTSSTRYRVEIPEPIEAEIDRWNLNQEMRRELYRRIDHELQTRGDDDFDSESVAPVPFKFLKFRLEDPASGTVYCFYVWVNTTEQEGTRIVINIKHLV